MVVYRGPGVFAEEVIRYIAPSPIAEENVVAIVSEVPPTTTFREALTVEGTGTVELTKIGIDPNTIKIFTRDEFTQYIEDEDYQVQQSSIHSYIASTTIARYENFAEETFTLDDATQTYQPLNGRGVHNIEVSTTSPSATYTQYVDWVYDRYSNTLSRVHGSSLPDDGTEITLNYEYGISDGEVIVAEYKFGDESYFSHQLFSDYAEVQTVFGNSWNPDGTPNPVTLMASMVFANGGPDTQVLVVPVNPHSTGIDDLVVNIADWQIAIEDIVEEEITMVLETSGIADIQSFIISNTLAAVNYNQQRQYFGGRDKTKDLNIVRQEMRDYASAINSQHIVMVHAPLWETLDVVGGDIKYVGGQYAAGALAGVHTRIRFQDTSTRRPIAGLRTRAPEREILLNQDTSRGLCVIENKKGFMRVRHATTTMFADVNQREISVVRAKWFIIKSLRRVLDASVIGMLMEPDVDFLVAAATISVLDRMKEGYVIASYGQPQVFQDNTDPTRLLLRFEYLPNYPVNEILIQFSISQLGATVIS